MQGQGPPRLTTGSNLQYARYHFGGGGTVKEMLEEAAESLIGFWQETVILNSTTVSDL